jgi:hypothetical protein
MNKYQKVFTPIIIVLIILFLVGIGGITYYLINKQSRKQTSCTIEFKICPNGSSVGRAGPNCDFAACPEAKVDETGDWLTYTNKEYGFEFKYPQDWVVNNGNTISILSPEWQKIIKDEKNSEYSMYYQGNSCSYCFNISINPKITSQTLEQYILENQGGFSGTPKKIKFAGESAYEVIEIGILTIDGIIVKKDNYLFDIELIPGNKTATTEKIENKIFSTFKFLK